MNIIQKRIQSLNLELSEAWKHAEVHGYAFDGADRHREIAVLAEVGSMTPLELIFNGEPIPSWWEDGADSAMVALKKVRHGWISVCLATSSRKAHAWRLDEGGLEFVAECIRHLVVTEAKSHHEPFGAREILSLCLCVPTPAADYVSFNDAPERPVPGVEFGQDTERILEEVDDKFSAFFTSPPEDYDPPDFTRDPWDPWAYT